MPHFVLSSVRRDFRPTERLAFFLSHKPRRGRPAILPNFGLSAVRRDFRPTERLALFLSYNPRRNCPTALPNFGLSAVLQDFHSVKKLGFALYYKPCLSLLGLPYPQNPVGCRLNRPRLFVRSSKNLSALFFGFVLLC